MYINVFTQKMPLISNKFCSQWWPSEIARYFGVITGVKNPFS